jgi:hypothetical protein
METPKHQKKNRNTRRERQQALLRKYIILEQTILESANRFLLLLI